MKQTALIRILHFSLIIYFCVINHIDILTVNFVISRNKVQDWHHRVINAQHLNYRLPKNYFSFFTKLLTIV